MLSWFCQVIPVRRTHCETCLRKSFLHVRHVPVSISSAHICLWMFHKYSVFFKEFKSFRIIYLFFYQFSFTFTEARLHLQWCHRVAPPMFHFDIKRIKVPHIRGVYACVFCGLKWTSFYIKLFYSYIRYFLIRLSHTV